MPKKTIQPGLRHGRLGAAATLAVALTGAARPAEAKIHVATAGPITGEQAAFGERVNADAKQAVADLNEADDLLGQRIVLHIGDDACPPDPRLMKTAADVVKEFKPSKVDPEGYVPYTHAAIQVWADAVRKVGTTDPKKVTAALKATGRWPTVLGPISFDKKGDTAGCDYVFNVWKDGSYAKM